MRERKKAVLWEAILIVGKEKAASVRFGRDSQERELFRGQQGDFAWFGSFWMSWSLITKDNYGAYHRRKNKSLEAGELRIENSSGLRKLKKEA